MLYLQADFLTQRGAEPNTPEFQTALQSAKKAVAFQPGLGDARVVLSKLYMQSGKYEDAATECRKALEINPKDQTAVYRLIQALRKTGNQKELPDLLKRLADLRKQAAREEGERNRYRLVEGDSPARQPQPALTVASPAFPANIYSQHLWDNFEACVAPLSVRGSVLQMTFSRRVFGRLILGSTISAATERLLAQGVAIHTAKPLARPAPSGRPFNAHFVDVAASAGLTAPTIYGGVESKKYILEATGGLCLCRL